ncbi:unnamed protein product [Gordionus sp. m RMFG-2023]|uniref:uncharacterized protein LOC135927744 isoform X2 n=1 Tax=Gordionus sp. m RMFG-2023 TaxID=3053472 RepID=UPI0030E0FC5E
MPGIILIVGVFLWSLFIFAISLLVGLGFPNYIWRYVLSNQCVNFKEHPEYHEWVIDSNYDPIYTSIYLWNITNPDEMATNLRTQIIGPLNFVEKYKKVNVSFISDTVSYINMPSIVMDTSNSLIKYNLEDTMFTITYKEDSLPIMGNISSLIEEIMELNQFYNDPRTDYTTPAKVNKERLSTPSSVLFTAAGCKNIYLNLTNFVLDYKKYGSQSKFDDTSLSFKVNRILCSLNFTLIQNLTTDNDSYKITDNISFDTDKPANKLTMRLNCSISFPNCSYYQNLTAKTNNAVVTRYTQETMMHILKSLDTVRKIYKTTEGNIFGMRSLNEIIFGFTQSNYDMERVMSQQYTTTNYTNVNDKSDDSVIGSKNFEFNLMYVLGILPNPRYDKSFKKFTLYTCLKERNADYNGQWQSYDRETIYNQTKTGIGGLSPFYRYFPVSSYNLCDWKHSKLEPFYMLFVPELKIYLNYSYIYDTKIEDIDVKAYEFLGNNNDLKIWSDNVCINFNKSEIQKHITRPFHNMIFIEHKTGKLWRQDLTYLIQKDINHHNNTTSVNQNYTNYVKIKIIRPIKISCGIFIILSSISMTLLIMSIILVIKTLKQSKIFPYN